MAVLPHNLCCSQHRTCMWTYGCVIEWLLVWDTSKPALLLAACIMHVMSPVCTGLKCSSHALDKLELYLQITKAQAFLSTGEMLCLIKIWLAQDTQTFFGFLVLVLNVLLHYQLPADVWCITEVLVATWVCFALFPRWKFAVLEPNASLSAGTTNCKQQIFPQSQPQTSRELQCKCSLSVLYKCRQQWATVCGQWLLTGIVLSLPRLWSSRQGGRGALAAQLNSMFIALL